MVLEAGGTAMGLSVTENRRLENRDALDPLRYDMLVTANNAGSLTVLLETVHQAWAA